MSTITQLLCNNFAGIREKNAEFSSNRITAQNMQNVELYYTGNNSGVGIRTAKGNVSINDSLKGKEKIIDIYESVQNKQTYCFVYTESETVGRLYLYDIAANILTIKKDNLTVTGVSNGFDIAQGWSDLFFFTNGKEMFTVELDSTDKEIVDMNLTDRDGRTVVGLNAALYNNRLFISNGNILWYSVTSNIYDFKTAESEWITTAGYIECIKNITAIHEYLGSLAIFYKDSSQLLSVSDGNFSLSEDSPGGCAGYDALVFHDTNLYFYDDTKKSVFSFRQVISGQKTLGENVAIDIQTELKDINVSDMNKIRTMSVFIEDHNEIWWLLPSENDDYSTILIYDYLKGEWVKRKEPKINSMRVVNNKILSAGIDGNIYEEYNSETFNGEYIQAFYNCSPMNLGADNTLKIFVFPPRVSFDLPYSNNFYVKYVKNYNIFKKPKVKYIKSKYKNFMYWDRGFWDVNYWFYNKTSNVGKLPNANFKTLEISIYNTKKEETFSIRNIEFSKIKVKQV